MNKSDYGGKYLWKRWGLCLEWKVEGVLDGESEGGDCDEVICAGWREPGGRLSPDDPRDPDLFSRYSTNLLPMETMLSNDKPQTMRGGYAWMILMNSIFLSSVKLEIMISKFQEVVHSSLIVKCKQHGFLQWGFKINKTINIFTWNIWWENWRLYKKLSKSCSPVVYNQQKCNMVLVRPGSLWEDKIQLTCSSSPHVHNRYVWSFPQVLLQHPGTLLYRLPYASHTYLWSCILWDISHLPIHIYKWYNTIR